MIGKEAIHANKVSKRWSPVSVFLVLEASFYPCLSLAMT